MGHRRVPVRVRTARKPVDGARGQPMPTLGTWDTPVLWV